MIRSLLLIIVAGASLAACSPSPQPVVYQQPPVYQQQPAPVIIQQSSGMGVGTAAALGAGAGFLAGRLTAPKPAAPAPTTVYVPVQPTIQQSAPAPQRSTVVAVPTPAKPAPVAVGATKSGQAVTFAPAKPSGISLSKRK